MWASSTVILRMNNSTELLSANASTSVVRNDVSLSDLFIAIISVAMILIIIVAVLGNLLVIYAFSTHHRLRQNVTNYFVVSLAVSDILTAIFVTTFELDVILKNGVWLHGVFICHVWTFMYLLVTPGSIINLLAVTVDRFLVLRIPLRYTTLMTKRRAIILIGALWFYAFLIAYLPILGWRMKNHPKVYIGCYFLTTPEYSIFVGLSNFLLLLIFMCFYWTKIYAIEQKHAKRVKKLKQSLSMIENSNSQIEKSSRNASISDENASTKKLFDNPNAASNKKQFKRHLRGSKYIAILVGAFFLCWLPFTCVSLASSFKRSWYLKIHPSINYALLTMGYLNSALNPFLYPFHDRQFREAFKNIFKRLIR